MAPGIRTRVDVVVVGGGIIGLATADALTTRLPGLTVTVLEKEAFGVHLAGALQLEGSLAGAHLAEVTEGAWIPIVTLTAAAAFGNTRYRTAAEMSVVILAAVAIDALVGHRTAQPDLEQVG